MNKNERTMELIIVIVQAACLLIPIAFAIKPLNPGLLLLAAIVGSCIFGYIGLQTDHLFCDRKEAINRETRQFVLFRGIAIVSFLSASIAVLISTVGNNNYDRAYLDYINNKLEDKEFSNGLGDSSKFMKFCEDVSLDYYSVQTIMDLFGEDARVFEEKVKTGEGDYLQLPTYFSDNPIILDMICSHCKISNGDLTKAQMSDEVDRIGEMAANVLFRSIVYCGIAIIMAEASTVTMILALFSKYAIHRNTKYLKEIEKNEEEKSESDNVDSADIGVVSGDSDGSTSHTEED